MKTASSTSASSGPAGRRPGRRNLAFVLTVFIGAMVGGNFALAKFVVLQGVVPMAVFFWQIFGAAIFLLVMICLRGGGRFSSQLSPIHLRYYFVGGLLGISIPQVLGYMALRDVPAGLFTMAVTLSPLCTFLVASAYERKFLPFHRIAGLLIGLSGVAMATYSGMETGGISGRPLLLLGLVPVFLALTNVFRDKAYPAGSDPAALAAGTLVSQVLLLGSIVVSIDEFRLASPLVLEMWPHVLGLMAITALSYILTFELYRHTDGVGFSQVGYFATLSGVIAGVFVFGESLSFLIVLSIALLFAGVAIGNGKHGVKSDS